VHSSQTSLPFSKRARLLNRLDVAAHCIRSWGPFSSSMKRFRTDRKVIASSITTILVLFKRLLLPIFALGIQPDPSWLLAEETPWEFDPYRMQVWLSHDPSLALTGPAKEDLLQAVMTQMDIVYKSTANIEAKSTPRNLYSSVLRDLDAFAIPRILASEFVLAAGRDHPAAKEIRTLDTILNQSENIQVSSSSIDEIRREMSAFASDPIWKNILGKLQANALPNADFLKELKEDRIPLAMIRRSELNALGRAVRLIPTRFPWQLDSLLKTHDKIFAISLSREHDVFQIQVREIDARLRVMSQTVTTQVATWEAIPRSIAYATQQVFAPMARIEEADTKLAELRLRAGGLIIEENHPSKLVPGDVLQPYVRRDDRNGIPTLLQSIPWTYVAIVETNGVAAKSAIFSGIRSALAGRKNRRTLKICLKVRPANDTTDLKLGVMNDPKSGFSGAEVYRRTPGTEDLTLVGRADWRGITSISEPSFPLATYERPVATTAIASGSEPGSEGSSDGASPSAAVKKPPEMEKAQIQLRAPLYIYYIKNGNTLLARLPIVTGNSPMERAELPDDRRRLESEAFVKGIQGEILDVVARRQILAARIKQKIADKKPEEAKKALEELRNEKNYEKMIEGLNAIQRRILSTDRGPITPGTQKRIDQMFDLTRQMMERYLQDSLLRDMELAARSL
jgi:hypothetical protein